MQLKTMKYNNRSGKHIYIKLQRKICRNSTIEESGDWIFVNGMFLEVIYINFLRGQFPGMFGSIIVGHFFADKLQVQEKTCWKNLRLIYITRIQSTLNSIPYFISSQKDFSPFIPTQLNQNGLPFSIKVKSKVFFCA